MDYICNEFHFISHVSGPNHFCGNWCRTQFFDMHTPLNSKTSGMIFFRCYSLVILKPNFLLRRASQQPHIRHKSYLRKSILMPNYLNDLSPAPVAVFAKSYATITEPHTTKVVLLHRRHGLYCFKPYWPRVWPGPYA